MYVFDLTATQKSKVWVEKHKININAVGLALSMIMSEIHPSTKIHHIKLKLQILYNKTESEYLFKTNKIKLCEKPYYKNTLSISCKHKEIFDHLLQ